MCVTGVEHAGWEWQNPLGAENKDAPTVCVDASCSKQCRRSIQMNKVTIDKATRGILRGCLALAITHATALADLTEREEKTDPKIYLLVATIETPDTRTDKLQKEVTLPPRTVPYSDAALQGMSGDELQRAKRENAEALKGYNRANAEIFYREYRRRDTQQEDIAKKAKNTAVGRNLILARDWLATAISDHNEVFEVVFRVDDQEAQEEKFLSDMEALDVAKCAYFVKVVVNDPKQSEGAIRTAGGNMLKRVTTKQLITVHVQDLTNKIIVSKEVELSDVSGESSVVMRSGDNDIFGELLRKCLKEAANQIAGHFSVKLTIQLKGPKDDGDFDADDAVITLNGREISAGDEITCVKAVHTAKVEMDGYETIIREFDLTRENGKVTKPLAMKKTKAALADEQPAHQP